MASHKKGARRKHASIAFLDETGFMLQPTRRRTWAPKGQTPVHKPSDRHDRVSGIGTLTVSPVRHALNLYFTLLLCNVQAPHLVDFVQQVHRRLRTPLIVVWDRSGPHRAAARELERRHADWVTIEWLPSYSPKLNPQEHCWDQVKYHDLPNFLPEDVTELDAAAAMSLAEQRGMQAILRSHFAYAKLAL